MSCILVWMFYGCLGAFIIWAILSIVRPHADPFKDQPPITFNPLLKVIINPVDKVLERLHLIFDDERIPSDKINEVIEAEWRWRTRFIFIPLEVAQFKAYMIGLAFVRNYDESYRFLAIEEEGFCRLGYRIYLACKNWDVTEGPIAERGIDWLLIKDHP